MERIPSEIWAKIFAYACTDSGTTGRRLSIISKFIREASAPVKLQSISIHGLQQIISFHQLLLQTPPHLRRIRHLFLSLVPLPPAPRGLARFMPSRRAPEVAPVISQDEGNNLRLACTRIFAAVAECIELLHLDVPIYYLCDSPDFPNPTFPRLSELTSDGYPLHTWCAPDDVPASALCPQLRRWHMVDYPANIFGLITTVAPSLTHLRFSGLQQDGAFPLDLKAALEIVAERPNDDFRAGEAPDNRTGRLPDTIQSVYVQPAKAPPRGPCGTVMMSYGQLMWGLQELNKAESRLVLLKEFNNDWGRICTSSEWLDRINGGQGCWSLRDRILVYTSN
ncbi:hypothetical protein FIBSPDRAFT_101480 [Athelia psychrophila]|uniref:F-box domain-containing protein n=1 Tax=Athelia psychrophila TaxID=1759441 RepID=A0A166DKQ9_9AGAM|nr:hypothetical protein FIBSPDRAFT_101480 [Fibularhizoctonia sp. CBS 109695]